MRLTRIVPGTTLDCSPGAYYCSIDACPRLSARLSYALDYQPKTSMLSLSLTKMKAIRETPLVRDLWI